MTDRWINEFLQHLRAEKTAARAAELAGISRQMAYKLKKREKWFEKAWEKAQNQSRTTLILPIDEEK